MTTAEIYWIDPAGRKTDLTGQPDLQVLLGMEGHGMPPVELVEDTIPQQPGARLAEVQIKPRPFKLPLRVIGAIEYAVIRRYGDLVRAFWPKRGWGRIGIVAPGGGTARELTCRHAGGMELVEGDPFVGYVLEATALFRAFDPYWYDTAEQTLSYKQGDTRAEWFPGLIYPPLSLASSSIFATPVVDNPGDDDAWPRWTITGPANQVVLANITTGQDLRLAVTLGTGESLTIDTRLGRKSARRNDGSNCYPQDGSALWALQPGPNDLQIQIGGATADTVVQLAFAPPYLLPW